MKQAIAGVSPAAVEEVTSMIVWPSVAASPLGQFLGRLYSIRLGFYVVTVGNLIALALAPFSAILFFLRMRHWYKLTNRRIIELRSPATPGNLLMLPLAPCRFLIRAVSPAMCDRINRRLRELGSGGVETRSVQLDQFDDIRIEVLPGQDWYFAGELVFLKGEAETFRLAGVSRPETFRASCLKARSAYVGVRQAMQR